MNIALTRSRYVVSKRRIFLFLGGLAGVGLGACLFIASCNAQSSSPLPATDGGSPAFDSSSSDALAPDSSDASVIVDARRPQVSCAECVDACVPACLKSYGRRIYVEAGCSGPMELIVCEPGGIAPAVESCALTPDASAVFWTPSVVVDGCGVVRRCTSEESDPYQLMRTPCTD